VPIAHHEVIGGLDILLGILTRIASVLLIIEMLGAILTVKLSKGFIGGYEFELLLIAICLSLVIMGPGEYFYRECDPKKRNILQRKTVIDRHLKQTLISVLIISSIFCDAQLW